MGSALGIGPSSSEKKKVKEQKRLAEVQAADLREQQRREQQDEAARIRSLQSAGGKPQTLFSSALGVGSDPLGGA